MSRFTNLLLALVLVYCIATGGPAAGDIMAASSVVSPPANRAEAEQLLRQGWELRGQGRQWDAIAALERSYAFDPYLTMEWEEGPNAEGARRHYRLIADIELAYAYLHLGRDRSDVQMLQRACQLLEAGAQRYPDGDALLANLRTCRALLLKLSSATSLRPLVLVDDAYVKWLVAPTLRNGRLLLPAGEVARAMGFECRVEGANRVSIRSPHVTIALTVGSDVAEVSGAEQVLDVGPILREGEILVPVRFVAEAAGRAVAWDSSAKIANIRHAMH